MELPNRPLKSLLRKKPVSLPASKPEETFSKTEVQQMLAEFEKKILGKVTDFGRDKSPDISHEEVDEDDILPKGKEITFFSHSQGKCIMDDKRHGKVSYPPYSEMVQGEDGIKRMVSAPYRFTKFFSREMYSAQNKKIKKWVCICVVESKKRAEWLRKHSLFGIAFYEKMEHAINVDSYMQDKLIETYNYINTLSDTVIIQRCKNENIPITSDDISVMKRMLVKQITEKGMQAERAKVESIAMNSKLVEMTLGKDGPIPKGMLEAK